MSNRKSHIKGVIIDNRLIWKKLIAGLDFHVGVEVFPSDIVTKNKVARLGITTSEIISRKEEQVVVYLRSWARRSDWWVSIIGSLLSGLLGLF